MKRNPCRRFLPLILVVIMIAILAACNNATESTPSTAPDSATTAPANASAGTEATPANANEEPTVLKYATFENYYANASYADGVPVVEAMEKIMNVKIEWELTSNSQYATTMETRLAANVDLPDIINLAGPDPSKYGAAGVLADITDLITPEITPHSYAWFQENPEFLAAITSPDGKVYQLAGYRGRGEIGGDPYGFALRTDWLETLGLEKPTTKEELYDVLVAFRDGDPNGNGQKDEIPFNGMQISGFAYMWGLTTHSDGVWGQENGKVYFAPTSDAYREYLRFINTMYTEGLMDPEFATMKTDQVNAKIARGTVGSFFTWGNTIVSHNQAVQSAGVENGNYDLLLPFKQVNGEDGYMMALTILCRPTGFSANSKVLKEAVHFMDWSAMSHEANVLTNFGIEDLSYTVDSAGNYAYTDFALNNPDGLTPMEALRSLGSWPTFAYSFINESRHAMNITNPQVYDLTPELRNYIKDGMVFAPANDEMSNVYNTYMNDITTYKDEMLYLFIDGSASLDTDWDDYVATVESMGIGSVVEIMQQRYDIANK